jgi:hypothetical protein
MIETAKPALMPGNLVHRGVIGSTGSSGRVPP